MGSWSTEKKYLSASGLLATSRKAFSKVKESSSSIKEGRIPLVGYLISGLALFGLKFPSLLRFDQSKEDEIIKHNLATLWSRSCIVHPDFKEVIPLCPEPIANGDGSTKNDCERNAAKRFIQDLRREHPFLNVIVTQDAISSNGPHVKELQRAKMHYIYG